MAIETMGAALRQIERLFAEGPSTGLSDASSSTSSSSRHDADAFEVAGGAARADGPVRLPRHPPRPERRRGRLPGHLPGAGQEGPARSGAGTPWAAGCTGWRTASRSRPTAPRPGGATARRRRVLMASATAASGPARARRTTCCRRCTRRSPGCPRRYRLAVVLCDLEGLTQAQAAGAAATGASGPSAAGSPRPASGSRPAWPAAAWRPTTPLLGAVVPPRGAGAVVPPAWRDATVRAALDIVNPAVDRRGRLGRGAVPDP